MLSSRGVENVASIEMPWRFAPGNVNKYDKSTNPTGLISFATAENIHIHQALQDFSNKVTIPAEAFSYGYSTCGGPQFPTAMAAHINKYFKPYKPIEGKHVITANSLTAINSMLGMNLGDQGDAILVSRPIYGRFELDFGNEARLKICYVDMNGVDSFEERVVERYEAAIGKANEAGVRIRAILISNPSNPLGKCYPESTLRGLMRLCQKYQIHLISDEVYALSGFDSGTPKSSLMPFTSVLSINTADCINENLCHVTYGMSKDFGAAGLRIGCLITRNIELQLAMYSISRFHQPSGPAIAIATAILEDQVFVDSLLTLSRSALSKGYQTTTSALQSAGIKYYKGGNFGFFVYADLSPFLIEGELSDRVREFELAQRLKDGGVFLHPGEEHNEIPGHFRLVFVSLTEDSLEEGLKRLLKVLAEPPRGRSSNAKD